MDVDQVRPQPTSAARGLQLTTTRRSIFSTLTVVATGVATGALQVRPRAATSARKPSKYGTSDSIGGCVPRPEKRRVGGSIPPLATPKPPYLLGCRASRPMNSSRVVATELSEVPYLLGFRAEVAGLGRIRSAPVATTVATTVRWRKLIIWRWSAAAGRLQIRASRADGDLTISSARVPRRSGSVRILLGLLIEGSRCVAPHRG